MLHIICANTFLQLMLPCLGVYLLTQTFNRSISLLKSTTVHFNSSLWSTLTVKLFQLDLPLSLWTPSLIILVLISEHDINLDATYISNLLQCNKLSPNIVAYNSTNLLSHRTSEVVSLGCLMRLQKRYQAGLCHLNTWLS